MTPAETTRVRTELLKFASELATLASDIASNVKAAGNNIDALLEVLGWTISDVYDLELTLQKGVLDE